VHAVGREIGTDRKYPVILDQDVGDRRLMDITLAVVDLTAACASMSFTLAPPIVSAVETTCARGA
jgi:hypothetical protein